MLWRSPFELGIGRSRVSLIIIAASTLTKLLMPSDTKRADSISVRYVWSFSPPKKLGKNRIFRRRSLNIHTFRGYLCHGKPKGSKNRSTILREAQEATVARGLLGHEQEFLDSLHVMEEGMRHFYVRAMAAKQTKQPDKMIDAAMIQAVQIADARLSAVKLG